MTSPIQLFGSYTSPYVRRVRIVAHELGLSVDMVEAATEEGQAALRAASPLWKVPAAVIDGKLVMDSARIEQYLMQHYGPGPLQVAGADSVDTLNFVTAVNGALDSLINAFYLGKEGVGPETAPYLAKQRERAHSAMQWIAERLEGAACMKGFGLPAVALGTTLEWMNYRNTYPVATHPALVQWLKKYESRPSMVATRPPE